MASERECTESGGRCEPRHGFASTTLRTTRIDTESVTDVDAIGATRETTGAGALNANARLDFRVVIQNFIRFQVGRAGATVDLVEFAARPPTSATAWTAGIDVGLGACLKRGCAGGRISSSAPPTT